MAILRASATVKRHKSGPRIMTKAEQFFNAGTIVFDASLPGTRYGESFENFVWGRIRLNTAWYGHPTTAAASIAHEACHLSSTESDRVGQEQECRSFDAQFMTELIAGVSYSYPTSGAPMKTARMTAASPIWGMYQTLLAAARVDQIIDTILAIKDYPPLLDADWVVSNINAWGGLGNRWATSLGAYVCALVGANRRPAYYAPYILQVLQALPAPYWSQAKPFMGDFGKVQAMLDYIAKLPPASNAATIAGLAKKFNDKLSIF